jgi:Domain of unknown function (DUF4785)
MRTLLSIAIALASFSAAAAQPLPAANAGDLTPRKLVVLPAPNTQIERAPVSFAWKLDPSAGLTMPQLHVAQSREYWQTVEAVELERGLRLKTTAPGALIRISPTRDAIALRSDKVQVEDRTKRAVRLSSLLSDQQLKAAGMPVAEGSVLAKLGDDAAAGEYTLRATNAQGRYVVNVYEPASTDVLRAGADRDRALVGDSVRLDVAFERAGRAAKAEAEGLLVAPNGQTWPLKLVPGGRGLVADVTLPASTNQTPGLWELQVFASAEGVQRDARTALMVAQPTARFDRSFSFDAQRMRMALPIVTASAGRYEARGTLFATAPDGVLRPVSQAHSAAWFERGKGMLALQFDRTHLPQGYGAPFEVRKLELHDQSRMAPLESRERTGLAVSTTTRAADVGRGGRAR